MPTSAFNYREATWNTGNISSLQKKVSILLGLTVFQTRALTGALAEAGLDLISGERFESLHQNTRESQTVDLAEIQARARLPFREISVLPATGGDDNKLFDEIVFLKNKVISSSILRNGIHLDRYRVGSLGEDDAFQVIFGPDEQERWRFLGSYSTEKAAVSSTIGLREFLVKLNVMSEGLHIVEHLLLRTLGQESHTGVEVPDGFYSFKISVVFPGWTARFHDGAFRSLAEETVQLNCPAHIHPQFYWLDFQEMRLFEGLYKSWLDLKCGESASLEDIDSASKQMISFFLEIGAEGPGSKGDHT